MAGMSSLPPSVGRQGFLKGEGDIIGKWSHIWRLWSSSHPPRLDTKLRSTHFSLEVAWSVVIAEHSGGIATLGSHQVTREDRMAVGVQGAISQHK